MSSCLTPTTVTKTYPQTRVPDSPCTMFDEYVPCDDCSEYPNGYPKGKCLVINVNGKCWMASSMEEDNTSNPNNFIGNTDKSKAWVTMEPCKFWDWLIEQALEDVWEALECSLFPQWKPCDESHTGYSASDGPLTYCHKGQLYIVTSETESKNCDNPWIGKGADPATWGVITLNQWITRAIDGKQDKLNKCGGEPVDADVVQCNQLSNQFEFTDGTWKLKTSVPAWTSTTKHRIVVASDAGVYVLVGCDSSSDPATDGGANWAGPFEGTTQAHEYWLSQETLYFPSVGSITSSGGNTVPSAPHYGLHNFGCDNLRIWADLDGDGDVDADIWARSNMYTVAGARHHIRSNISEDGATGDNEGRLVIGATDMTNYIQSAQDFAGNTGKDLAFGDYNRSNYWQYFDQSNGGVVGFNTSAPRARIHAVSGVTVLTGIFETTGDQTVRVGFRGMDGTADNNATIGTDAGERLVLRGTGLDHVKIGGGFVQSAIDGGISLGSAPFRFDNVYLSGNVISTSDGETKTLEDINDAEIATAKLLKTLVRKYKFNRAIAEKGDSARTHFGFVVQEVIEAFEANGLDAFKYSIVNFDKWDEQTEKVFNTRLVEGEVVKQQEVVKTRAVRKVVGGKEVSATEMYTELEDVVSTEMVEESYDTGETEVVKEKGSLYSLSYNELYAFLLLAE